jgi:hypothetical protein
MKKVFERLREIAPQFPIRITHFKIVDDGYNGAKTVIGVSVVEKEFHNFKVGQKVNLCHCGVYGF